MARPHYAMEPLPKSSASTTRTQAVSAPAIPVASRARVPAWRRYYDLTKPKVVLLILFTALVGMLLSTRGMVPLQVLLCGLLGIALASAAGAALNHLVDQRIDALMERTRRRPLPSGAIDTPRALAFSAALAAAAMLLLATQVNALTAVLTGSACIGYAVIYSLYLKRRTPHNIVWGGLAGAMPPLLGWTAVTGRVSVEALLLVLIIFVWTPPHFWPLAIKRRREYARAAIPMLPVTHGVAHTKRQVLRFTLVLLAVSLGPCLVHMSGPLYLAGALVLGSVFIWHALRLLRSRGDDHAMRTFGYSIFYLAALFALLLADHYLMPLQNP